MGMVITCCSSITTTTTAGEASAPQEVMYLQTTPIHYWISTFYCNITSSPKPENKWIVERVAPVHRYVFGAEQAATLQQRLVLHTTGLTNACTGWMHEGNGTSANSYFLQCIQVLPSSLCDENARQQQHSAALSKPTHYNWYQEGETEIK